MKKTTGLTGWIIVTGMMFIAISTNAQIFYNNGATIQATEGALVFVDGAMQNENGQIEVDENAGTAGEIIIQDDFTNNATAGGNGYYRVLGDWINNNTFNAGTGTVFLEGADQLLDGSVSTSFNNLTLDGSGLKTQTIDQYCTGILDLKDLELQNETHAFYVENTDVNAIIRTTGFVSALDGGFLSRQTNSSAIYLFPVGSSVGTTRYRPVEITPENTTANTYTVRMANLDATTEGFDRSQSVAGICEINPLFYHQIDRSAGTAAIDLSIFFDESTDGSWEGISNWTTGPDLWDIITGSSTAANTPLDEAFTTSWNNFNELPYALYNAIPDVVIGANSPVCMGDDINLTESGGSGVSWSWSGPDGFSSTQNNPVISGAVIANEGTYHVTVTDASGCQDTASIFVEVLKEPAAAASSNSDVCEGSDLELYETGSEAVSWEWDGPGTFNSTDQNPVISPASSTDAGTYTVIITDANGCTASSNTVATVNPVPAVDAGTDFDVCEGEDINLFESGGDATSWDWTGPGTFTSSIQDPSITNATTADAGIYLVEVSDINGCTASDDVTVTVNENPETPTADIDCSGGTDAGVITVTSPLGTDYEYSIDGTNFQAGTSFGPLPNGSYTITVENITTGCTSTGNSLNLDCGCTNPTDLSLASLSGSTCVESPFSLSGNTFGGSATEVTLSHDGDGTLNATNFTSSPFEFIYTPAISDAGNTISITLTTDNPEGPPCSSATETFLLNVRDIPNINADSNSPVCESDDIELYETGGDADSWSWSGPDSFSSTNQNPVLSNASSVQAGTYTVVITDTHGCTATDDVTVTINPTPTADAGSDFSVCEGDDINLNETGGDAVAWDWSGPGTFTSTAQDPSITNASSAEDGTYTVEITDGNGCVATDDVYVTVNPTPDATITDPGDFCSDDAAIDLTAATGGGTWTGDGITDAANGTFDPSAANTGANSITYEVTAGGCTGTDNITIQVNPVPNIDAGTDFTVCEGEDINLYEAGGDAITWDWSGPGTFSSTVQDPSVINATTADDGNYTVEIEDANGCIATDDVYVTVNPTPDATITDPGDFCS
ncbi:MAG: hypothetical protein ACLFM1_08690, partial [Bacteroidales bacterium]